MNRSTVILLLLLSTCIFTKAAFATSLSVGWESWYPYQYNDKEQKLTGLDFDIFNAIVKQAKLNVSYTETPWKRHLHDIKIGRMDIAMGAFKNKAREKFSYFTAPYRMETVKLFVLSGMSKQIKLPSLQALINSNFMLGVESGYYYGDDYQALLRKDEFRDHINEVTDLEENISHLFKGHIDGFLADPVTMKAFADKYKLHNEFEQHPLDIYHSGIHIMLSKQSTSLAMLKRFNKAIAELSKSGKIKEILDHWSKLEATGNFHF
jgi:polar amino acid transport system substrate-binding protein